jgi:hypothetical protein
MVDTFQILLFIAILTLTVIISVVGLQVFLVLREVHRAARNANVAAEEIKKVAEGASFSLQKLTGSLSNVKGLLTIIEALRRYLPDFRQRDKSEKEE